MEASFTRRLDRARRETNWLNFKTDILPAVAIGLATAGAAVAIESGGEHFKMSHVTIPIAAGIAALLAYWLLANALEFGWNLFWAGERVAHEKVDG